MPGRMNWQIRPSTWSSRDWVEYSVLLQELPGRVRAIIPALPGIEATAPSRVEAVERVKARVEKYLRRLRDRDQPWPREERIRIRLSGGSDV